MRIAILGGGQLAKMTATAAAQLGIETLIWADQEGTPASQACTQTVVGRLDDPAIQAQIVQGSDVITLESEFIPARTLEDLSAQGGKVVPFFDSVAVVQDKWTQKSRLMSDQLAVASGRAIDNLPAAYEAGRQLGYPVVVKTRRLGYDGHGTFLADDPKQLEELWHRLEPAPDYLLAEQHIPFVRELSVIVTRGLDGQVVSYPVVETRQPHFVCEEVLAPAALPERVSIDARDLAEGAARALNLVGTLAVEMFLLHDGKVVINEIAPRPHNSGHFSIEACQTSQFENHVRAILGFPLGSTALETPAAVMVNILGRQDGPISPAQLADGLAVPGVHIHLYGKTLSRPMRKLGHITALGETLQEAQERAWAARKALPF